MNRSIKPPSILAWAAGLAVFLVAGLAAAAGSTGSVSPASPSTASSSPASSSNEHHGAIAYSDDEDHLGHGLANEKPSEKEAADEAVATCQTDAGPVNTCKVVIRWHNGCGAFAESSDKKHHGVGEAGLGRSANEIKKKAEKKAVDACLASGAKACRIRDSGCTEGLILNPGASR